jgi:hypothetical protein
MTDIYGSQTFQKANAFFGADGEAIQEGSLVVTDPTTLKKYTIIVKSLPSASNTTQSFWQKGIVGMNPESVTTPNVGVQLVDCPFLNKNMIIGPVQDTYDYSIFITENGKEFTSSYAISSSFDANGNVIFPWRSVVSVVSSDEMVVGLVTQNNYNSNTADYTTRKAGPIYSYDGFTWFTSSMDHPNYARSVCWSPTLNRFVAVGRRTTAWYSDDGILWKITTSSRMSVPNTFTSPSDPNACTWNSVIWDSYNSKFIAVGTVGTDTTLERTGSVMTSVDGINWNIIRNAHTASGFTKVVSGNGTLVALGQMRSQYGLYDNPLKTWLTSSFHVSTNGGTSWTRIIPPFTPNVILPNPDNSPLINSIYRISDIAYSPTLNKFYAPYMFGADYDTYTQRIGSLFFYTSSNGVDWGTYKSPIWPEQIVDQYNYEIQATQAHRIMWSSVLQGFITLNGDIGVTYKCFVSDDNGSNFRHSDESDVMWGQMVEAPDNTIYNIPLLSTGSDYYNQVYGPGGIYTYSTRNDYAQPWVRFHLLKDNGNPYATYIATSSLGIIIDSSSLGSVVFTDSGSYTEDVMVGSTRYLRELGGQTVVYDDEGVSGLYDASALIPNGTFVPSPNSSFRFTTTAGGSSVTSIPNHLSGSTGLTFDDTPTYTRWGDQDDAYWEINLPFSVEYNGTVYSTIYVGSNSHITFDEGYEYNIDPDYPSVNKIGISSYDNYCTALYYGQEGNTFRIRWEGTRYSYQEGGSKVWEMTFYQNTPNQIDLHIGDNANTYPAGGPVYHYGYYQRETLTVTTSSKSTFSASLKSAGRDYVAMWYGIDTQQYGPDGSYLNAPPAVQGKVGMILNLKDGIVEYQEDFTNADQSGSYYMLYDINGNIGAPSDNNYLKFESEPTLTNKGGGYWELAFKVGFEINARPRRYLYADNSSYYGDDNLYRKITPVVITPSVNTPPAKPSVVTVPPRTYDSGYNIVSPRPDYWWRADIGLTTSSWTAVSGSVNFTLNNVTTASSAIGLRMSHSIGTSSVLPTDISAKHIFLRIDNITPTRINYYGTPSLAGGAILGMTSSRNAERDFAYFFLINPNSNTNNYNIRGQSGSYWNINITNYRTGSKLIYTDFEQYAKPTIPTPATYIDNWSPWGIQVVIPNTDTRNVPRTGDPYLPNYRYEFKWPSGSRILLGRRLGDYLWEFGETFPSYLNFYIKELAIFTSSLSIAEAHAFSQEMLARWP